MKALVSIVLIIFIAVLFHNGLRGIDIEHLGVLLPIGIYFVFCLAVGFYGKSRGHSSIACTFLALILSPVLGFIIVAFLGVTEKKTIGGTKECPFCAESVQLRAKVCKHCHSSLVAA